jgi:carboxypeptidase Taq
MNPKFDELKDRLMEIYDLTRAGAVLEWDQETMMPPKGAQARAEQLATLARISHEKFTSSEIGRLLEELRPYEENLPSDSDEASLIRVARRDYQKQSPVPAGLTAEMTRTGAIAREAWVEAKNKSNFKLFLPHLERTIELKHRYIDCFGTVDNPYDILLDDYERDMKTAEVQQTFEALKKDLVPLIAAIKARSDAVDDRCLRGHFPVDRQREFCLDVISRFGFNSDSWRLDPTVHPFTTSFAIDDVRITTHYYEDIINPAIFGCMHECGHGLYDNGSDPALERTLLCGGASLAWHESQSRLWENLVGRSRALWKFFYPKLQAAFPDQFKNVEIETFYRAVNKVQPSLIRMEADEATYGLHIILRFELEQEILQGQLRLRDLPEAWNTRMKAYLGVEVPDDAHGVLQDTHWAWGAFGYFPTYSLGNIIGAQLWEKINAEIPDLYVQFEYGEFSALREWLREHLYKYGRKFTPPELRQRILGGPIDVGPFIRYLKHKYAEIYGIS